MTYWPISSPSVFAATKNTSIGRTPISHDGTDHASQSGRDGASEAGSTNETDDNTSTEESEELKEEEKEQRKTQTDTPDQFAEDDVHGEIVAIRVTRSGQLFATLTRTTLTIWQAKVRSLCSCKQTLLTYNLAYRHSSFSPTLAAVAKNLWSQYGHPTSPRLSNLRRSDHAWLSDHVLSCNRSLIPRIQNTIHGYTWNAFEER